MPKARARFEEDRMSDEIKRGDTPTDMTGPETTTGHGIYKHVTTAATGAGQGEHQV